MRRRVPDASKLFEYTGFQPRIGLDDTLRQVIGYEMRVAAGETNRAPETARPA
jgi:nucleoside-diphosphate-sugar epimerase